MSASRIALTSKVRLVHDLVGQFPGLVTGRVIDLGGGAAKVRWTNSGPAKGNGDVHAWHKIEHLEPTS